MILGSPLPAEHLSFMPVSVLSLQCVLPFNGLVLVGSKIDKMTLPEAFSAHQTFRRWLRKALLFFAGI